MTTQARRASNERSGGRIDIEFLFLDLKTCTRCVGTDRNLEQALSIVEQALQFAGIEVQLRKILVDSPEKAVVHRFVTSPTVRVNGRDIALETRESKCDSCTDLCVCAEGTNCRVWLYRGREYTEAPVAMIVEAILEEAFQRATRPDTQTQGAYERVPENLMRFFSGAAKEHGSPCCSPAEQQTCCEPVEKASCCDNVSVPQVCGCQ